MKPAGQWQRYGAWALHLHNLVVVITGASSGNGRAMAHAFARQGARLILVARSQQDLDETAVECRALGGTALPMAADVGDSAAVERIGEAALQEFGQIDIWINNAAIIHFGRIEDTPPEIIDQVLHTNINGYFNGTRVAIRQFRRAGGGMLINVSSVLAITAQPYGSAYVASKAAVRALSESIRQEVADVPGIKVCTVLPYAIDTPIYQRAANYSGHEAQPVVPRYSAQTVADTVLALVQRPRREVYAGKIGAFAALAKAVFPPLSDLVVSTAVNTIELRREPAPPTAGNAFVPLHGDPWTVGGGWKKPADRQMGTAIPLLLTAGAILLLASAARSRRA
jgi:short-subunit dehydrogenase